MNLWICKKCGYEVSAEEYPDWIEWSSGHQCEFVSADWLDDILEKLDYARQEINLIHLFNIVECLAKELVKVHPNVKNKLSERWKPIKIKESGAVTEGEVLK